VAATSMVFLLATQITSRPPVLTATCTAPVYKPVVVEFEVPNPFPADATYKVLVIQDAITPGRVAELVASSAAPAASREGANSSRGSRRRPGQPAVKRALPPAEGAEPVPDPFWCKLGELVVRAGRKKKLALQFLPFYPGPYSCIVQFLDPALGCVCAVPRRRAVGYGA
jgi:hypothetical protein